MAEIRMPNDDLRAKLDRLAEKIVDGVMEDQEATRREMTEALKTASQWWSSSRKGEPATDEPGSAWKQYQKNMNGGTNGKTHSA